MKKEKLNCQNARNVSIIDTMTRLAYKPAKINAKSALYFSPFRNEKTLSFKVDIKLNRWYDHSEGSGGNVIDLVSKIKNCSVVEALTFLSDEKALFSFQQPNPFHPVVGEKEASSYKILKIGELQNEALLDYLKTRKINLKAAIQYCYEIYYKMNGKPFFSIAFRNDHKGYELRNKYFKGCIGNKNITTIKNGSNIVFVFEGFIDFLSHLTLFDSGNFVKDYIILNSVSLAKEIVPLIKEYSSVYTFLDNDDAGKKATTLLMKNHVKVMVCNLLFHEHNDLNDYLVYKEKNKVT
ncbi:toprim domain-containing protein [Aquimarina macrocephali]|uniref:toprim domain-containing protein n=1 Tax=Aquimarina macrocephali TaxID=666563 RepID=UPI003F668DEA